MLEDSGASFILTQTSLLAELPEHNAQVMFFDALDELGSTGFA
jgi:hypothetical protein